MQFMLTCNRSSAQTRVRVRQSWSDADRGGQSVGALFASYRPAHTMAAHRRDVRRLVRALAQHQCGGAAAVAHAECGRLSEAKGLLAAQLTSDVARYAPYRAKGHIHGLGGEGAQASAACTHAAGLTRSSLVRASVGQCGAYLPVRCGRLRRGRGCGRSQLTAVDSLAACLRRSRVRPMGLACLCRQHCMYPARGRSPALGRDQAAASRRNLGWHDWRSDIEARMGFEIAVEDVVGALGGLGAHGCGRVLSLEGEPGQPGDMPAPGTVVSP